MSRRESAIWDHFHPEEHPFVERVLDWTDRAARGRPVRTPFLDPRGKAIVESLVGQRGEIQPFFDGGYEGAERCRCLIAPRWIPPKEEAFGLSFLSVRTGRRSGHLRHPDVLGALLGLGIKREMIGDILISQEGCFVIAAHEIADFVVLHLDRIGSESVSLKLCDRDELVVPERRVEQWTVTVASLRADALVSSVFRLSRAKASEAIRSGKCRVNWQVTEDPSRTLGEGDTVSLRGWGRFRVHAVEGKTKKGRFRVRVEQPR
jgi:RNA-binding protein YlmH